MQRGIIDFPKDRQISDELKDLVRNTLLLDSKKRYNINDIINHPFYNKISSHNSKKYDESCQKLVKENPIFNDNTCN